MTDINSKEELIATLKDSRQRVLDWFTTIPAKDFFTRQGEEWSPAENVDHIIRAHKPITLALRLPRLTLQTMFGKPEKPSMPYEALCQLYRDEIAKGAQASGRFLPNQEVSGENVETKKMELLSQLAKVSAELIATAEKWKENELDNYQLPHPVVGKITVREMLYFTVYHNLRHASLEGD